MSLANLLNRLAKSVGDGRKAVSLYMFRMPGKTRQQRVLRESAATSERRILAKQREPMVNADNPVIFVDDYSDLPMTRSHRLSDSESPSVSRHNSHTCDDSSYVHSYSHSSHHCDSGSSYSSDSGSSDSGSYSSCD